MKGKLYVMGNEWNVLYMGRIDGKCNKCGWLDTHMINPKNKAEIEEIERCMYANHALETNCPGYPTITKASN